MNREGFWRPERNAGHVLPHGHKGLGDIAAKKELFQVATANEAHQGMEMQGFSHLWLRDAHVPA